MREKAARAMIRMFMYTSSLALVRSATLQSPLGQAVSQSLRISTSCTTVWLGMFALRHGHMQLQHVHRFPQCPYLLLLVLHGVGLRTVRSNVACLQYEVNRDKSCSALFRCRFPPYHSQDEEAVRGAAQCSMSMLLARGDDSFNTLAETVWIWLEGFT